VGLLQRAGYPDHAMITMLQRMDTRLAKTRGLGFAKTHPSARSRIDLLRKVVKGAESAPDPVRQQRFSAALQPLLAGQ
jgi:predicted Zn-dependent protease